MTLTADDMLILLGRLVELIRRWWASGASATLYRPCLLAAWATCPATETYMSSDLKRLVSELEKVLAERGGSLDAPAHNEFKVQIENLKRAIEEANAAEMRRLSVDALNMLAALLSVITNLMTFLQR